MQIYLVGNKNTLIFVVQTNQHEKIHTFTYRRWGS